jgi:hypothetical protein
MRLRAVMHRIFKDRDAKNEARRFEESTS